MPEDATLGGADGDAAADDGAQPTPTPTPTPAPSGGRAPDRDVGRRLDDAIRRQRELLRELEDLRDAVGAAP